MQETTDKEIMRLEKQNLEINAKYLKLVQEILVSNASIKNDTTTIKEHQGKNNLIVFAIVFTAGILFGLWFKVWTPIAGDVIDAVQLAKHIKGN